MGLTLLGEFTGSNVSGGLGIVVAGNTGTSSLDTAVILGTTLPNSSLTSTARILSIKSGISSGTEIEKVSILGNGTVSASFFSGDGSGLTNIVGGGGVSATAVSGAITASLVNVPVRTEVSGAITASLTNVAYKNQANIYSANQTVTGNVYVSNTVSSSFFIGDGSGLINIVGAGGVSATAVSGAITASLANVPVRTEVSGAITASLANVPVRTEVSGAITASLANVAYKNQANTYTTNQTVSGNVYVSNTVSSSFFVGDGSGLINLPGGGGGVSAAAVSGAITASQNQQLTLANVWTANQTINSNLYVTGAISSSYFTGDGSGLTNVIGGSGVSAAQLSASHQQLVHYINFGPSEYYSNCYLEVRPLGTPFTTSSIWYTDNTKTKKIYEEYYEMYSGSATKIKPTPIVYTLYKNDGVTILIKATDTITYSGMGISNVSRSISSSYY